MIPVDKFHASNNRFQGRKILYQADFVDKQLNNIDEKL